MLAFPPRSPLVLAVLLLAPCAREAAAQNVLKGSDLFVTLNDGQTTFTFGNIPAGLFGPGSGAVVGFTIPLRGVPLGSPAANGADTIIERLQDAVLSGCPSTDTVDVQIRALSLQSTGPPIVIPFSGGATSSSYRAAICLSSVQPQPLGSMQITRDRLKGGTFLSTIPVTVKVIFTKVAGASGNPIVVLDPAATLPLQVGIQPGSPPGDWSYTNVSPSGSCLFVATSPGGSADHDCSALSAPVPFPATSNFFAGIGWVPGALSVPACTLGPSCQGASGSAPTLIALSPPMTGGSFTLLTSGKPNCPSGLFFSLAPQVPPLDLTPLGFGPACGLHLSPLSLFPFGLSLLDGAGSSSTTLIAPPGLAGARAFAQATVFDQSPPGVAPFVFGSVTNALELDLYDLLPPGDPCNLPCTPIQTAVLHVSTGFTHSMSPVVAAPPPLPPQCTIAQVGAVIVTEFMAAPLAASNPALGDWVEIFNATSVIQDVEGWSLEDTQGDFALIQSGLGQLPIPPGGRIVLTQTLNPFINGGVATVALPLTNFTLNPTADEIILRDANGGIQDRVCYDTSAGWPGCTGASVSFTQNAPQFAIDNDIPANWCCSTTPFCTPFLVPSTPPCPPGLGAGDPSTPSSPNFCP